MGWLGVHIECSCSRACGVDVPITDVTIKTPDRKFIRDVNDINLRKRRAEDLRIWKKADSWDLDLDEASRFLEFAEAKPVVCGGGTARGGVRWKSLDRRKLRLSLLMSKNLKLKKVIKRFVPEQISCISEFPMSISRVRILVVFLDLYILQCCI